MAAAFADWLAICITSLSCFSIAVYVIAMAWYLVRGDWGEVLDWSRVRKPIRRAVASCRAGMLVGRPHDASSIDVAVHTLAEQRKSNFFTRALLAVSPIFAIGDAFLICRAAGIFQLEQTEHPKETHLTVAAAARLVAALSVFREGRPHKGVIVAFHVVGYGSLCLTLYSFSTGLEMFFDRATSLGIRVMFVLALSDVWLTIFCNSVYFAVMMYKIVEFASNDETIAQLGIANCVYQEIGIIVGLVVFHNALLWRLETEARTTIDAKMSTNLIGGLRKLLNRDYDVVVELDDNMSFTDDAKDLAGVLLHDPHRSLRGSLITDLMVSDADKEVFSTHVTQPSPDLESQCCAIPHMFHMRDSCGNVLCMEVWHTQFEDVNSQRRHLIGVKELANYEDAPLSPGRSSVPTDMQLPNVDGSSRGSARRRRPKNQTEVSDNEQPRKGQIPRDAQQRPQENVQRTVESNDSDGSSVSSAPSERSRTNMLEGFRPTSAMALRASTLHLLTTWNVALCRAQCCSFHALVKEAAKTVKWLAHTGCQNFHECHSQAPLWQCPNCGILSSSAEAMRFDPLSGVCIMCRDIQPPTFRLVAM